MDTSGRQGFTVALLFREKVAEVEQRRCGHERSPSGGEGLQDLLYCRLRTRKGHPAIDPNIDAFYGRRC